jgi:hypothetical protein
MIVQVCRADGVVIGKFEEADFQKKIERGELPAGQYSYWHDGMPDWKPISEYKPPGRVTKILGGIPTREMMRAELAARTEQNSRLTKLKQLLRPKGKGKK